MKGSKLPPNTKSVTRPGKHGNPFYPGCGMGYGFFDEDMRMAEHDVRDPRVQVSWFRTRMTSMRKDRTAEFEIFIAPLRGRNLACFCKLCEKHEDGKPLTFKCSDCAPCHVDVYGELLFECVEAS